LESDAELRGNLLIKFKRWEYLEEEQRRANGKTERYEEANINIRPFSSQIKHLFPHRMMGGKSLNPEPEWNEGQAYG